MPVLPADLEGADSIDVATLAALLGAGGTGQLDADRTDAGQSMAAPPPFVLLDVREPWEMDLCSLPGSLNIPLGRLPQRRHEIPADRPLVVLCHHGIRSAHAATWLRQQGFDPVLNMTGGIDAWARRIDPTMKVY